MHCWNKSTKIDTQVLAKPDPGCVPGQPKWRPNNKRPHGEVIKGTDENGRNYVEIEVYVTRVDCDRRIQNSGAPAGLQDRRQRTN